ncbi:MAG: precorrin-6A/cobalt-precorrin-6A reductase [Pseudomonadota bacterium]|nr:precorrin-6A/cobalt-precorrin-6A reductase [Pseudomonadota bacterium]
MTVGLVKVLVLAGTAEARAVIDGLRSEGRFDITASLAGATPHPAPLPVPTISGGFGGADGLAVYCREHGVGLIVDVTHPFARQISHNAQAAAYDAGITLLRYERPPWLPEEGDDWRSFESWQDMADAIAPASRVFLAGGTQSIDVFTKRKDITLWARALNVAGRSGPDNVTFINAMPSPSVAEERAQFLQAGITLLCCKNSGGDASSAKIAAAREIGIPVWFLARRPDDGSGALGQKSVEKFQIHDSVEQIVLAAVNFASSHPNR